MKDQYKNKKQLIEELEVLRKELVKIKKIETKQKRQRRSCEPYDLQIKLSHHNLAFTDWYKKLMSTGKTVISDLHISAEPWRASRP